MNPEDSEPYPSNATSGDATSESELKLISPDLDALVRTGSDLSAWISLAAEAVDPPPPLGHLGLYVLLDELGRGGQGVVFRSVQPGTNRHVALKRLGPGLVFGSRDRERFSREIEALTRLAHPSIVTVFAAEVIDGHPVLIMELVEGISIDRWADGSSALGEQGQRPSVHAVLKAFVQVCDAVAHAHQRGVIHRDIKPSNVLIDVGSVPRVVDFGIARLLDDLGQRGTVTTMTGFVGTPAYASPEQLDGRSADIDARSDVYALGVLLYRLLTGQEPFRFEGGLRVYIECISRGPQRLPSQIRPGLHRDLDWIILHAISPDASRRYATVDALAQDVRRFLAGEAVSAHPPSRTYLAAKFVRRHKAGVSALALVLLTLAAGIVVSTMSLVRERSARYAEVRARTEAELRQYIAEIRSAASALQAGDVGGARGALADAPEHLRGWEWHHLLDAADDADAVLYNYSGRPGFVHFAASDRWFTLTDRETGSIELFEHIGSTARFIARSDDGWTGPIIGLWHDEGLMMNLYLIKQIVGQTLYTRLLFHSSNMPVRSGSGYFALFTTDQRMLVRPWNEVVEEIDRAAREETIISTEHWPWTFEGPAPVNFFNSTADTYGQLVAVATYDGVIRLHDATDASMLGMVSLEGENTFSLNFSPDGTRLAVGTYSRNIYLLDTATLDVLMVLDDHAEVVSSAQFLPDNRHLVSASWDGTLRVWDLETGLSIRTLRGHAGSIRDMSLVDEGTTALTFGDDGSVRRWSMNIEQIRAQPDVLRGFSRLTALAMTPEAPSDGWIIVLNTSRPFDEGAMALAVNMRDPDDRRLLHRIEHKVDDNYCSRSAVDISADGRFAALGDIEGQVHVFDLHTMHHDALRPQDPVAVLAITDRPLTRFELGRIDDSQGTPRHDAWVDRVRFSPDGSLLAASAGRDVEVFSLPDGNSIARTRIESQTTNIDFAPDGQRLVLAASHGTLWLWSFTSDATPQVRREGLGPLSSVAWSPDGRSIAVSLTDGTARLLNAQTLKDIHTLRGHIAACRSVSFSPDSSRLVTASDDRTVRLWHVESGFELITLRGHELFISEARFSPDGQWIVSVAPDNSIRFWSGKPASP